MEDFFWNTYLVTLITIVISLYTLYIYCLRKSRFELKRMLYSEHNSTNRLNKPEKTKIKEHHTYMIFRNCITSERIPSTENWESLKRFINDVYPTFEATLYAQHKISTIEYHVCLLLKLGFLPKEISILTCRSIEAITSIRRRLSQKLLNAEQPSPKLLDNYIKTI